MVDSKACLKVLGTKHCYHVLKVDSVTAEGLEEVAAKKTNESVVEVKVYGE